MDLKTTARVVQIQQMIEVVQWRECFTCKDFNGQVSKSFRRETC